MSSFLPSTPPPQVNTFSNKISPSILLIIVILAVIFFVSGLLHLLVRYLFRPSNRQPHDPNDATALQGQLQQLFHLHDSGVDQSFIDTLPVFLYKAIIGLKDPFDCAVCLCEFEPDDKLRLLPRCSHAFHLECIDTWLLSHSTCPLCRGALFPDYSPTHTCSPVVFILESSSSDSSREIGTDAAEDGAGEDQKLAETAAKDVQVQVQVPVPVPVPVPVQVQAQVQEERVVPVILGKFRNVDAAELGGEGTSSGNSNLDERRCFSMGSHEYVMDANSLLQVAIKPSKKKPRTKKLDGHRLAMSECDFHSTRGFDLTRVSGEARIATAKIEKKESFSVSKIWLRSRGDKPEDCSRRALSFRLPLRRQSSDEAEAKENCSSSPRWEKSGSEFDFDVETGSCNNSLAEEAPSFTRRTLLWIMGRQQNKVVNHI